MPIGTPEDADAASAALAESEARPLLERLADPRTHRPVQLREDARARIAELEAALAFYADPRMHASRGLDGKYPSHASVEGGELARRTLGERWDDIEPAHVDLDL